MAKRPSLGRQKIKIAKIQNKNHLQVTFSKRRSGLFKKASELSTLCGVEITIIVFSPAGKVFSFGHPRVEAILERFLTSNPPSNSKMLNLIHNHNSENIGELNKQLNHILNELENAQIMGTTLDFMKEANETQFRWKSPIDLLGFDELGKLKNSMEYLKNNVTQQETKVMNTAQNNFSSLFPTISNSVDGTSTFDMYEPKVTSHFMMSSSSKIASLVNNFGDDKLMF